MALSLLLISFNSTISDSVHAAQGKIVYAKIIEQKSENEFDDELDENYINQKLKIEVISDDVFGVRQYTIENRFKEGN